jgi:hypothetical protein
MKLSITRIGMSLALALPLLFGAAEPAAAHICLDFPISRAGSECVIRTPQKIGPCGINERSLHVNVFRPGETIEVVIRETINHPSHYRIAFNPDGDDFPDPVAVDDIDPEHPYVLLDGIEDEDERVQTVQITFPEIECENCTLQLIQVMYDKQGNGFGGARGGEGDNDDLYYACADIALRGEPLPASAASAGPERGAGTSRSLAIGLLGVIGLTAIRPPGRRRDR